jgi:hypothetical protein
MAALYGKQELDALSRLNLSDSRDAVARRIGEDVAGPAGDEVDAASLGRLAPEAATAPLVVNNDRALLANAQPLLIRKDL